MPRRLPTCLILTGCVLDFAVSETPTLDRRTHSRRMDSTREPRGEFPMTIRRSATMQLPAPSWCVFRAGAVSTAAATRMPPSPAASLAVSDVDGRRELRFAGRLDPYSIAGVWPDARAALDAAPNVPVAIDASSVDYCDGGGIAMLVDLLRQLRRPEAKVSVVGLRPEFRTLLDQFDPAALRAARWNTPSGCTRSPKSAALR